MKTPNLKTIITLALLFCLSAQTMLAEDYTDKINNEAVSTKGQRVVYELNVGSFTTEGTFAAAQERLAELKALGIDVVWLMPIYPRGGGINSPYAATNFQKVNSSYGTIADLKDFVTRAHELKMEVWLDWVPNHTATNADWVKSHPEYYKKNGSSFVHPNNYSDVYQLNYGSTALKTAMNDCLKFWIDQADIDGYRCDYISSPDIPFNYWAAAIPEIKSYKAGKTITFLGEADIVQDKTNLLYAGFDYDYAWGFQEGKLKSFGPNGNNGNTVWGYCNSLITASTGKLARMVYLTNHDQNYSNGTLTTMYGNNRYPLTVLSFTIFGMPLLYNGQEIGDNQKLDYFHDTKINWANTDKKMLNTVRTLTALKHAVPALNDGKAASDFGTITRLTSSNSSVLAFKRVKGDSEAIVVLNFSASAVTTTISGITAGDYGLWLDSKTIANGVSRSNVKLAASQSISLDAKGYAVYVKGKFDEEQPDKPEEYTPVLDKADEISFFFETPTETTYSTWAWDTNGHNGDYYMQNTTWPGDDMKLMGTTSDGKYIYKYIFTKVTDIPTSLIISYDGGNSKVYNDVAFVNHGYYVQGQNTPTKVITTTGISKLHYDSQAAKTAIYDLGGRYCGSSADRLSKGIYIQNGRKFVVK